MLSEWNCQYEYLHNYQLPSAQELHCLLSEGKTCRVKGHTLTPDEHGIWITNPYGIDSLWQELTIQRVQVFLIDMELEQTYGPVP